MALKIEDGKTASDALSGCAPIDWVKTFCSDFALAWDQTVLDVKNLVSNFLYGVQGTWDGITSGFSWLWEKITNHPVSRSIVNGVSYGIGLVRKGWNQLDKCAKTLIKGTAIVVGGVVAIGAGIFGLCAIAGAAGSNLLAAGLVTISAGLLLRAFASGVRQIYNFNWNQTDTEIEAEYKQRLISIASRTSETLGYATGTVVCGWLPGTAIATFNPVLSAKVKAVMPELWDEMREEIVASISTVSRLGVAILFKNIYKNVRTWIKKKAHRYSIFFGQRFDKVIQSWGAPGSKAWSFASGVEEKIESIQNPMTRAIAENAIEGLFEGCDESIFTLAGGL